MKLALITDTHFGIRNDNTSFINNNKKFFGELFFPYLKEHNIDTVIHLGDLVDRRKYINFNTSKHMREDFLDPLKSLGIKTHIIVGNHDTYYKNTNEVNSLRELVDGKYENIVLYDRHATEVVFDGTPILFIPWICDDNRDQVLTKLQDSTAAIAMGHLEISGFEMYKGSIVSHGEDRNSFDRFDLVFSGHYHHRSTDGSIYYLGAHAEFTWSDYDDPRGFHIFDTVTREVTFVQNPYKIFKKVWYNDQTEDYSKPTTDFSEFTGSIVKVVVTSRTNMYWFDKFITAIEEALPLEIQIVEDHLNLALEDDQDIVDEAESTLDICKKYISNAELKSVNKEKLSNFVTDLYLEAMSIE